MILKDVSEVDFESVKRIYVEDNAKEDVWELKQLQKAQDKFGRWIHANIPISEIGQIVLPHYRYGGIPVNPLEGNILKDTYWNFKENYKIFEEGNSQFCERIRFQEKRILEEEVKSIFLSEEPLFIGDSYSGLKKFKGMITHLDGFHRLVAIMSLIEKNRFSPKSIESYIAIYPDSLLISDK